MKDKLDGKFAKWEWKGERGREGEREIREMGVERRERERKCFFPVILPHFEFLLLSFLLLIQLEVKLETNLCFQSHHDPLWHEIYFLVCHSSHCMLCEREGKGVSEVIDRIGVGVSLKQYDRTREREKTIKRVRGREGMTIKRERERKSKRKLKN